MNHNLSHHFHRHFQVQKIQPPRDFQPLPTNFWFHHQEVVLEIGAGKGKHALDFARQHPKKLLIAIERTKNKFFAMQKQANIANLPNLLTIHADAIAWIVHTIPPNCLSKIFILYPNPEPNNPNQRWLNMPFFEFLLSRLKINGQIVIASNIQSYIDEANQMATNIWQLPTERQLIANDSQRTHFEIKYLARGESCWQLILQKPQNYRTRFD